MVGASAAYRAQQDYLLTVDKKLAKLERLTKEFWN